MVDHERIRYISRLSENLFKKLCIQCGLSCSQPDHDENGWDAFVEFPTNSLAVHRDGQPPPIKSLVQVKATDGQAACPIEMTISNWEKLAQTSLPSFMVLFYFNGDNDPQDIYVCHFDNHRIAQTLRKVREVESEQSLDVINHRKMMFRPREEERLDQSVPNALKRFMANSAGLDAAAYAEKKAVILRTTGFDTNSHTLKFPTSIPSGELSDVFLGLREISVQDVTIGSRRFGIELLDRKISSGIIKFTPTTFGKCKIAVSSRVQKERALLNGEMFAPAFR